MSNLTLLPNWWWAPALLAFVVFVDAVISLRPPSFVQVCLDGVRFPREWWWTLVVIKTLAAIGLVAGLWLPGVGFAANVGVIVYFACAAVAHVRARFLGQVFWVNCLGMLTLAIAVLVASYAV